MYIFKIGYILLMFLALISLQIIQKKDVFFVLRYVGKAWILIAPIVAILLRMIRSNMERVLGWDFAIFMILYTVIVPLTIFVYVYFLLYKKICTDISHDRYSKYGSYAAIILLGNEIAITILDIIVNNIFFSGMDFIFLPLVRMALLQTTLFLFFVLYIPLFYTPTITLRNLFVKVCVRTISTVLILVLLDVLFSLGISYSIQNSTLGIVLLFLGINIGWICTVMYEALRKRVAQKEQGITT